MSALLHRMASGDSVAEGDVPLLDTAVQEFPYVAVLPLAQLLLHLQGKPLAPASPETAAAAARLALLSDDPRAINALRGTVWNNFYPQENDDAENDGDRRTNDAITLFLNTYGHQTPQEDALLERLIFNPAPDYAEVLAREEQENLPEEPVDPDSPEGRIDAFILSKHPAAQHPEEPEPEPQEKKTPVHKPQRNSGYADGPLSESLAAVYIRQHKYSLAYDIIQNLSNKFPGRNTIYLPQLAYMRKLINLSSNP